MANGFTYYWCDECEWDSIRSRDDIRGPCPMCAGDGGGSGRMRQRPARDEDGAVEGKDDRKGDNHENP